MYSEERGGTGGQHTKLWIGTFEILGEGGLNEKHLSVSHHGFRPYCPPQCLPPPPPDTPPHPVHTSVHAYERSNTYVTSHARHAMRMGWSEASLSPGQPPHWTGRGTGWDGMGSKGEKEEGRGEKQQAGMKVRKPSLVKKSQQNQKDGNRNSYFILTGVSLDSCLIIGTYYQCF